MLSSNTLDKNRNIIKTVPSVEEQTTTVQCDSKEDDIIRYLAYGLFPNIARMDNDGQYRTLAAKIPVEIHKDSILCYLSQVCCWITSRWTSRINLWCLTIVYWPMRSPIFKMWVHLILISSSICVQITMSMLLNGVEHSVLVKVICPKRIITLLLHKRKNPSMRIKIERMVSRERRQECLLLIWLVSQMYSRVCLECNCEFVLLLRVVCW